MKTEKQQRKYEIQKLWQLKHPGYMKDWRQKNPEAQKKQATYYKQWYKKNGRRRTQRGTAFILNWHKKHPEARKAHQILNSAIKKKIIHKPLKCSCCEYDGKLHGHHEDYDNPLRVIWLCPSCHKKVHKSQEYF